MAPVTKAACWVLAEHEWRPYQVADEYEDERGKITVITCHRCGKTKELVDTTIADDDTQ